MRKQAAPLQKTEIAEASRQRLELSATDPSLSTAQLSDLESSVNARLLDLTIDQLRTLVIVFQEGSALKAAKLLHRQQSSIQSQLTTLNKYFIELCGEKLCSATNRGENYS